MRRRYWFLCLRISASYKLMYVARQVLNIPGCMSFITIEKCDSIKIKVSSCIFRADKTEMLPAVHFRVN